MAFHRPGRADCLPCEPVGSSCSMKRGRGGRWHRVARGGTGTPLGSLLRPAISKAPRHREAVSPTARIARARSCDLTATGRAPCGYTGCGLQSRDPHLYPRLVVCEVGFLACDTGAGDKAAAAQGNCDASRSGAHVWDKTSTARSKVSRRAQPEATWEWRVAAWSTLATARKSSYAFDLVELSSAVVQSG
jgi:hypothetical protein